MLMGFSKVTKLENPGNFLNYSFIIVQIAAISLFIHFKGIKLKSKIINQISPAVFGIYLISDHPDIRDILYTNVLHVGNYNYSYAFFPYMVVSVIGIFVCCMFIELMRQKILTSMQKKTWDFSINYLKSHNTKLIINTVLHR
jgi:hypothetical protein